MTASPLATPFRSRFSQARQLGLDEQLRECADYLQHPEILVMEFLESYHLIEREWSPDDALRPSDEAGDELVLEPFYESLELEVRGATSDEERLVCVSGSLSPLPMADHPALSGQGLDFVGRRVAEADRIVMGVAQSSKEETPYVMLLRALNCLAELSPPLRVVQLGNEVLRDAVPENARFDLILGISEPRSDESWTALGELTRDLAEVFKRRIAAERQFDDCIGWIDCADIEVGGADGVTTLRRRWRV
jgi:hypothetical protein